MGLGTILSTIKFSHSVFALPFALCGAWLAAEGMPAWDKILFIVGACVSARSAAMGFNRLADRRFDAQNPRTAQRELPAGKISALGLSLFVLASAAAFLFFSWMLGRICLLLAPAVLAVLFLYSLTKRWTWTSHVVLGLCLGFAPLGAWLAVRGNFEGNLSIPLVLGTAVLLWVAGFDLIYACQDEAFDRRAGLHSFPARFGVAAALRLSSILHVMVILLLTIVGWSAHLGIPYWIGIAAASALLMAQHRIVRPDDLSRVNMAFFTLNGWVGIGLFAATALDYLLR